MATVTDTNLNVTRQVKNLGWLLRNWKDVICLEVKHNGCTSFPNEAYLKAFCRNDKIYETDWASFSHCIEWLDRPVFKGCNVTVIFADGTSEKYEIGSTEYQKIKLSC